MKKLFYLGFCLVLLVGFGCAITDYGTITDNNQVTAKKAGKFSGIQPVIDTKGRAHIQETSQIATIWPDGTDELLNFVDQKADGTAKLTTYNNFSTGPNEPTFHDDLYCNTDRQGCSVFDAPDNNDGNLFDGTFNTNCSGARSLSLLLSTGRYYGECGKLQANSKVDLMSKAALFNSAIFAVRMGREGLLYNMNSSNLSIHLTNANGVTQQLPLSGTISLWRDASQNIGLLDMRNSLVSSTLRWYRGYLAQDATSLTTATLTYNGISADFTIGGSGNVTYENLGTILNRSY